jgi:hypothetical protein
MLALSTTGHSQENSSRTAGQLVSGCRTFLQIESGTDTSPGQSDAGSLLAVLNAGYCTGYIAGFINGNSFAAYEASGKNTNKICIPKGVTTSQVARVLVRRMEEKPEFEHVAELPFVIGILQLSWACK